MRGLGTAISLPLLDAMSPLAKVIAAPAATAGKSAAGQPIRMAFLYVPNGMHMKDWTPETEGANFDLPPTLKVLEAFKEDMLVLSNLAQDKARPNGDGAGDHARSMASYLTGCQAKKTGGADIRVGVSIDQLAAQKVGTTTRFASLELSTDRSRQSGECDSGYSCAYSSNLSWKSESSPVPAEVNPRLVFERLFAGGSQLGEQAARAEREKYQKSILDYVLDDADRLRTRLGRNDQRKMDEYLTSVRELETRLNRVEQAAAADAGSFAKPAGIPTEYRDHLRLMADLLVLAFQTDSTRVATFVLANESSNRAYPQIEVSDGHHDLSHHGNNKEKQAKIAKINRFHMEQFAYLLERMKSIREGERTLLDNSMLVYGSGIGDGNRHNHDKLPVVLLGKGGGTIQTGRHIKYEQETPLNNLWLSMLDRMGVEAVDRLGDSNGRLKELAG